MYAQTTCGRIEERKRKAHETPKPWRESLMCGCNKLNN